MKTAIASLALIVFGIALFTTSVRADQPAGHDATIARAPELTDAELAPYSADGTATLTGRVLASLPGDRLRAFAHQPVFAVPAVRFAYWNFYESEAEWKYGAVLPILIETDQIKKLNTRQRLAVTDDEGIFRFKDLPAGKWIVYANLTLRDGRQYSYTTTDYSPQDEMVPGAPDEDGRPTMDYQTVYEPHSTEHYGGYTCETAGLVLGVADVPAGQHVSVPLGLAEQRNQGC